MATATDAPVTTWENVDELLEQLGGIAPARVRMRPLPGTATEADLIAVNERKGGTCELVDGILVEKGISYREAMLAGAILAMLRSFVLPRNLGIVTPGDAMMRLFPGLVRVPDVAFASWGRIPGRGVPTDPVAAFAPDLAVEVLSPSNTQQEMARKRREYFAAGVRLVWEVDPRARTVAIFDDPERSTVLDASMALDGGDVLPGFALPLGELFGELDRRGNP